MGREEDLSPHLPEVVDLQLEPHLLEPLFRGLRIPNTLEKHESSTSEE